MNITTEKLPPDVIKAFENLGDLQRGLPEMAMLQIQFANGGGVLNPLVEHLGDITHRMTHLVSRDTVLGYEKILKTYRWLNTEYGFEREMKQNIISNFNYRKKYPQDERTSFKTPEDLAKYIRNLLHKYAEEHAKLPVYNKAQWLARQAAIFVGLEEFTKAKQALKLLLNMCPTEEIFKQKAMKYSRNNDGSIKQFTPSRNINESITATSLDGRKINILSNPSPEILVKRLRYVRKLRGVVYKNEIFWADSYSIIHSMIAKAVGLTRYGRLELSKENKKIKLQIYPDFYNEDLTYKDIENNPLVVRIQSYIDGVNLNEMAVPSDEMKSSVYYHGTIGSIAAKSIMEHGLQGRTNPGKGHLSPVKGRVYITPDIYYAIIYALGGDYRSHMIESKSDEFINHLDNEDKQRKIGFHKLDTDGYVFVIRGSDLVDIQPDEDSVGEFITHNSKPIYEPWKKMDGSIAKRPDGTPYNKLVGYECNILSSDKKGIEMYHYIKSEMTSNQLKKVLDGEYMYLAAGGKRALKKMPDWMKIELINRGAHIAHNGSIIPSECWKIDKNRYKELKKDGSNFFSIAKRIK